MPGRLTTKEFIEKAKSVHGHAYNYDAVDYDGAHVKVCIICPTHGAFEQTPGSHLWGRGCPSCAGNTRASLRDFVVKAQRVHGDLYDYSRVRYVNNKTPVEVACYVHGSFWVRPDNHVNLGHRCRDCYLESNRGKTHPSWRVDSSDYVEFRRLVDSRNANPVIKGLERDHIMPVVAFWDHRDEIGLLEDQDFWIDIINSPLNMQYLTRSENAVKNGSYSVQEFMDRFGLLSRRVGF